ncbi:hypothetical protein HN51_003226 [Arachis hypogaea]
MLQSLLSLHLLLFKSLSKTIVRPPSSRRWLGGALSHLGGCSSDKGEDEVMEDQYNGNKEVGQEKGNVVSEVHDENNNSVKTTNILPTEAPKVEGNQTSRHKTNEEQNREGQAIVVGESTSKNVGRYDRKRIKKKHARPPLLGTTKLGGKTPTKEARAEVESVQKSVK